MSLERTIKQNLTRVRGRIASAAARAGRSAESVTLVAVTKSVGLEEIRILRELGVRHFGENRVDVARAKIDALGDSEITWHMVGSIQRRKASDVVQLFDMIDAVDRVALADALQRHCEASDVHRPVLVQVNVSGEAQKHGFSPDELAGALEHFSGLDRLTVSGLMTMAPYGASREALLAQFGELRDLAGEYGLPEVSMGMSGDFEEAIEAGATQVRVGRTLFD